MFETQISRLEAELGKSSAREEFHHDRDPLYVATKRPATEMRLQFASESPFEFEEADRRMRTVEEVLHAAILEYYLNKQNKQKTGKERPLALLKNVRNTRDRGVYLFDGTGSLRKGYPLIRGIIINEEAMHISIQGNLDLEKVEGICSENTGKDTHIVKKGSDEFQVIHPSYGVIYGAKRHGPFMPHAQLLATSQGGYALGMQGLVEIINRIHQDEAIKIGGRKIDLEEYMPLFLTLLGEGAYHQLDLPSAILEEVSTKGVAESEYFAQTRQGNYRFKHDVPHMMYIVYNPKTNETIFRFGGDVKENRIREELTKEGLSIGEKVRKTVSEGKKYRKGGTFGTHKIWFSISSSPIVDRKGSEIGRLEGRDTIVVGSESSKLGKVIDRVYAFGLLTTYDRVFYDPEIEKECHPCLTVAEAELMRGLEPMVKIYEALVKDTLQRNAFEQGRIRPGQIQGAPSALQYIRDQFGTDKTRTPQERFLQAYRAMHNDLDCPSGKEILRHTPEVYAELCQVLGRLETVVGK